MGNFDRCHVTIVGTIGEITVVMGPKKPPPRLPAELAFLEAESAFQRNKPGIERFGRRFGRRFGECE